MNRPAWRAALIAALVVVSVLLLLPSVVPSESVPQWWPWKRAVRLGLDLKGGTHLVYSINVEAAIDNAVERDVQELELELREAQIGASTVERRGRRIYLKLANPERRQDVLTLVRERFGGELVQVEPEPGENADFVFALPEAVIQHLRETTREQALRIVRNRIDEFGIAEPTVQTQGADEIVIQLPGIGVREAQRAKELIGKTALLEFKLVARGPQAGTPESPGPGVQVLYGRGRAGKREPYLIERRLLMTGDVLTDARVAPGDATEGMVVNFTLDKRGAKLFADITQRNVGRQLAIILDGVVESAPVIEDPITGGQGLIRGNFTLTEAQDLANVLRNGTLPAPLKEVGRELNVGPSLGQDSIRRGLRSLSVATALIVSFMMLYYRGGGMIADLALVLNVVFLMTALVALDATLSLPGIFGIVLTIGMAVDANVLILERVREELRGGKTPRAALDAGYDRAWSAILDSNVTTFLSGLILFQFGSGPVRGFAVTLCLGILTTLFTAVFGTRTLYLMLTSGRRLERVSV